MKVKVDKHVSIYFETHKRFLEFVQVLIDHENMYVPDKWFSPEAETYMRPGAFIRADFGQKNRPLYDGGLREVGRRNLWSWDFKTTYDSPEDNQILVKDETDLEKLYDSLFEWEDMKETILHKFMRELNEKLAEDKRDVHVVLSVGDSEIVRRYTGLELSNIHFRTGIDVVRPSFGVAVGVKSPARLLRPVTELSNDTRIFISDFAEKHFGVHSDSSPFNMVGTELGFMMFSSGLLVFSDIKALTSMTTRLENVINKSTVMLDTLDVIRHENNDYRNDYSANILNLLTVAYNIVDVPVEFDNERKELIEKLLREAVTSDKRGILEKNLRKVLDQNSLTGKKGLYDFIALRNFRTNWPDFHNDYFYASRSPLLEPHYIATLDIAKGRHQALCLSDEDEIERDLVHDDMYCKETNSLSFPADFSNNEVKRVLKLLMKKFPNENIDRFVDYSIFAKFQTSTTMSAYDWRYSRVCFDKEKVEETPIQRTTYEGRYKNRATISGALANSDFWSNPTKRKADTKRTPKTGLPFKKISIMLARTLVPTNQCTDCDVFELSSTVFDEETISFIAQTKFKSSNGGVCPFHSNDDNDNEDDNELNEAVKEIEEELDGKFIVRDGHNNNVLFVKNGDLTPPSNMLRDIMDYNATPDLLFLTKKDGDGADESYGSDTSDDPFMGVEIEIDKGGLNSLKGHTILSTLTRGKPYAYAKTDGSLSNGFEFITVPATLGAHMDPSIFRYKEAFETAVKLGFRAHDTSTCGIHVHVNRNFFGETRSEQLYRASLMALIMEKNWEDFVTFTRRNYDSLDSWARKKNTLYHYNMEKSQRIQENKDVKTNEDTKNRQSRDFVCEYEGDKYSAINIEHRHTFEFRIFRSTLRYETYISILQFVDNFARLVKEIELDDIDDVTIGSIIKYRKYKELFDYVGERSQSLSIGDLGDVYYDDPDDDEYDDSNFDCDNDEYYDE